MSSRLLTYVSMETLTANRTIWRFLSFLLMLTVADADFADISASENDNGDVINSARCLIRCLSLLTNPQINPSNSEKMSLAACQNNDTCVKCSLPCNQQFLSLVLCEAGCEKHKMASSCRESCQFLRQVNHIRPGTCPQEMQATGFAALCIKSCDNDADCDAGLKCCSNSCGWTCQNPAHVHDGMPDIPDDLQVDKQPSGEAVFLKWASSNTSGPILYIVESRSSHQKRSNDATQWSTWQKLGQTTDNFLAIDQLRSGFLYQFRVASVNIYGSQGMSEHSLPFFSSREPNRPDPPTNLTEGETLVTEGKIAVSINWSPPAHSDLPISRYKLYWSKRLKSSMSLQEYRQVLPGDRLSFQVVDLDPDSTYFIQVQAISQYGETRLKSEKAGIYIVTEPLSKLSESVYSGFPVTPIQPMKSFVTPSSPSEIFLGLIYFQNGLLKANITWEIDEDDSDLQPEKFLIYWSPEACAYESAFEEGVIPVMSATTSDYHFIIYDLRFDCRYLIRLQSVSQQGAIGPVVHTTISTPFCHQVTIVGEIKPDCPRNEEPVNLRHSFVITSTNISSRLSWEAPASESAITGYQVVWGQILPASHNMMMDKSTSITKSLPKDVRTITVGSLLEATTYSVRVQAMSRAGLGRVASIRFTTPRLQSVHNIIPPYKEVGSQQESMVETVRPDDGRRRQELNLKPTTLSFGDSLAQHSSNDAQQQRDRKPPYSKSSADLAKSIFSCLILIKFIELVIV